MSASFSATQAPTPNPKSRSARWFVLPALAALACLSVFGLWWAVSDSGTPKRKLPDGTWVELRDSAIGINPTLDERPGWWKILPRTLVGPAQIYNANPVAQLRDTASMNAFLVTRTHLPRTYSGLFAVVRDEHGCYFEPRIVDGGRSRACAEFCVFRFEPFPADSRELALGFRDTAGRLICDPISVHAPSTYSADEAIGRPRPLPDAVQSGDLKFVLTSLEHRDTASPYRERARFRVLRRGIAQSEWRVASVTVTDPSAASITSGPGQHPLFSYYEDEFRFSGLCRNSATWELNVTFRRHLESRKTEDRKAIFVVKP
jgi:hypothetical protein